MDIKIRRTTIRAKIDHGSHLYMKGFSARNEFDLRTGRLKRERDLKPPVVNFSCGPYTDVTFPKVITLVVRSPRERPDLEFPRLDYLPASVLLSVLVWIDQVAIILLD